MTKDLLYISSINKYLSVSGDMYTDEDLDFLMTLERDWKDNLPNYTFYELIKMFPEATASARRSLKTELKKRKQTLRQINEKQQRYQENRINKAHFSEQNELKEDSDIFFDELRDKQYSKIKTCVFNLSFLDEFEGKAPKRNFNNVNEAQIAQAKQVLVENFYNGKLQTHGKRAKGKCPFHPDKTASFTIYLDQNSFYCYGCNFGGSVVDYIMRQQNINFLSAVKRLLNDKT
jgi:hypothetical protein|tara:strand:- start:1776 stop:2471 length:696 start_codon:yes stop_codon:yes gene_type:complete